QKLDFAPLMTLDADVALPQKLDFAPLMTLDADVALPQKLLPQTPTIREALVAHGFQEEFRGDDMPPATLYHLGDSYSGFYAEFLTPLTGGEYTRSGKRKATAQIAGVNSQQLRFLEPLLNDPWTVELSMDDFGLPAPKAVRVANPMGFLAQKLLIHRKRCADDQAKDILYIHDTLQVFGARFGRPADRMDRPGSSQPAPKGRERNRNCERLALRQDDRRDSRGGGNRCRPEAES
ncbi:MAG TPA: hypothetical protein DEH78_11205, partial [Solibacterales bacterium]|nr:hypothetical protein [Bryobacterales bacterium]